MDAFNIVIWLIIGGTSAWGSWRSHRELRIWQRVQGWRRAVAACGFSVMGSTSRWSGQLQLVAQAWPVQLQIEGSRRLAATRIALSGPEPPGHSAVRIHRVQPDPGAWAREVEIGDEPFDAAFSCAGPTLLVCALLDAKTRALLSRVNALGSPTIAGSEIRAETSDQQVSSLLPLLLELRKRFAEPVDVAGSLAENARLDPVEGVRLRNLLLLARGFASDPRAAAALRTACSDPSPEIRLRAAIELGAEGRGFLLELVEKAEDDARCAQAVAALVRGELPQERIEEILLQALRRRHVQTARAGLEALGARGNLAAIGTLAKVAAREHGELAAAAARALGATGSTAAEPPLIGALDREPADLRLAAADALATVGSPAAVLPLKEAARRFPHDRDLDRATRQAIAAIQSRRQGATPGQLSLAGVEAGQLSLASDAGGQLSLPGRESGQLSLSGETEGQV